MKKLQKIWVGYGFTSVEELKRQADAWIKKLKATAGEGADLYYAMVDWFDDNIFDADVAEPWEDYVAVRVTLELDSSYKIEKRGSA